MRAAISRAYATSKTSERAIIRMYDAEYGGKCGPHYGFLNILLCSGGFNRVVGVADDLWPTFNILDVGAGSNELLRFLHEEKSVPKDQLSGTDISQESVSIILRDGCQGYHGRLEDLQLPKSSFDMIFLSYFIDYDTDQRETIRQAVRLASVGGKIVLEGLFPCRPLGLFAIDRRFHGFVTKGKSAEEDIQLVCQALSEEGEIIGRSVAVDRIVKSDRYIYNRNGFHRLDSTFIVVTSHKMSRYIDVFEND